MGTFRTKRGCCGSSTPPASPCVVCSDSYGDPSNLNSGIDDCSHSSSDIKLCANGSPDQYAIDFEGVSFKSSTAYGGEFPEWQITDGVYTFTQRPNCLYGTVLTITSPDVAGGPWNVTATLELVLAVGSTMGFRLTLAGPTNVVGDTVTVTATYTMPNVTAERDEFGIPCTDCGTGGDCWLTRGNIQPTTGTADLPGSVWWPSTGHLIIGLSGVLHTYANGETVDTPDVNCTTDVSISGIGTVKDYATYIELTGGDGVSSGSGKITLGPYDGEETAIVSITLDVDANDYVEFKFNSPTDVTTITAILDLRPGTYLGESYDLDFGFTSVHGTAVAAAERQRVETYDGPYSGLTVNFCLVQEHKLIMRVAHSRLGSYCVEYEPYGEHSTDYEFSVEAIRGVVNVRNITLSRHGNDTLGCATCGGCDADTIHADCKLCSGLDCDWQVIDGTWDTEGATFIPTNVGTATILTADTAGGPSTRGFMCDLSLIRNAGAEVNIVLGWRDSSNYYFAKIWRWVDCIYVRLGAVSGGTPSYEDTSHLVYRMDPAQSWAFRVIAHRVNNGTTDTLHVRLPDFGAYFTWDTLLDLFDGFAGHDEFGFRSFGGANTMTASNVCKFTVYDDDDATTWLCPTIYTEPYCSVTNECCEECIVGTYPEAIEVVLGHGQAGDACCDNYAGGRYILTPLDRDGTQAEMCEYQLTVTGDSLCGGSISLKVNLFDGDAWLLRIDVTGGGWAEWDSQITTHASPVNCRAFVGGCGGGWGGIVTNNLTNNCTFAGAFTLDCPNIICLPRPVPSSEINTEP